TDRADVTAAAIRAAVGEELGVTAIASDDPRAANARGEITVTYRFATQELAVAFDDRKRGTIARVVPAPSDPRRVAGAAALLAGNLARNEADEMLGAGRTPAAAVAPQAIVTTPPLAERPPPTGESVVTS